MKNFTPEIIEKAKESKNAEKPLATAKKNSAELSDDELGNVAGGTGIISQETESSTDPDCADEILRNANGYVTGCTQTVKKSSTNPGYAGGILGYQDGQATITDCSNTGTIINN